MAAPAADRRAAWLRHARRVARRVNAGWWADATTGPLVVLGLAGACAILLARREAPATPAPTLAGWALGAAAAVAAAGWLRARRHFESPARSLVRIEAAMHLRNRLSAARAGAASWPEPPARADDGLRWRWSRLALAPLAALGCLAAGILLPVSTPPDPAPPPHQPPAWQQLSGQLDLLENRRLADPRDLAALRRQLDLLRRQPPADWFSHASLEATDSLRRAHTGELQRAARDLDQADRALGSLQHTDPAPDAAARNRLADQFQQALQGLQQGALRPNQDLLERLARVDPQALDQTDPLQFDQLREALRRHADAFDQCLGRIPGAERLDDLLAEARQADAAAPPDAPGGHGRGAADRGPGTDPRVLGRKSADLATGPPAGLHAADLSRSLPGDLVELHPGRHEVDRSPAAPATGGTIDATGHGGNRIRRDALDPDEQRVLRRFFR